MLTTTIAPSGARAQLAGFDIVSRAAAARAISSVVFQEAVVDRESKRPPHLDLHARLWGVSAEEGRQPHRRTVAAFGLAELIDRPVASYSGGQRRRLEIARALISEPSVLFLDEPTVGLDPRIRRELLDVIGGLRARHDMTILLTTHYLEEAEQLCDRVAIIHQGEIVALDTPSGAARRVRRRDPRASGRRRRRRRRSPASRPGNRGPGRVQRRLDPHGPATRPRRRRGNRGRQRAGLEPPADQQPPPSSTTSICD